MELLQAFNPIAQPSGSFVASSIQAGSKIIVRNKSYVDVQIIFSGSQSTGPVILANESRAFSFTDASNVPNGIIYWKQLNIDYPQTVIQLGNIVYVEMYSATEAVTETYPCDIVRETLPTLYPYRNGFGGASMTQISPNQIARAIFPSSYFGVTCAPTGIQGSGFDHFYGYYQLGTATWVDLPGVYTGTGKTRQDATPISASTAKYIPGPFSLLGLEPVDTAINFSGAQFNTPYIFPNSTASGGWYIDFWYMLTTYGVKQYFLSDGDPTATSQGVNIYVTPQGVVTAEIGNSLGFTRLTSFNSPALNVWHHVALYDVYASNTAFLWIDGNFVTSGSVIAPANSLNNLIIGNSPVGAVAFTSGSIGNIGLLYNPPNTLAFSQPATRWLLGQQSKMVDMQHAWLTGFDIDMNGSSASWFRYSFSSLFNPAGLLFADVLANTSQLHQGSNAPLTLHYNMASNTVATQESYRFDKIRQFSESTFIIFTEWQNTGPVYDINVFGFNILGMA